MYCLVETPLKQLTVDEVLSVYPAGWPEALEDAVYRFPQLKKLDKYVCALLAGKHPDYDPMSGQEARALRKKRGFTTKHVCKKLWGHRGTAKLFRMEQGLYPVTRELAAFLRDPDSVQTQVPDLTPPNEVVEEEEAQEETPATRAIRSGILQPAPVWYALILPDMGGNDLAVFASPRRPQTVMQRGYLPTGVRSFIEQQPQSKVVERFGPEYVAFMENDR